MVTTRVKGAGARLWPAGLHRLENWLSRESEAELALLPALCDPERVSIDVGAHNGLYTHWLRPVSRRVIAFEPLPPMREKLSRTYGRTVRVEQVALSDENGVAVLRVPHANRGMATITTGDTTAAPGGSDRLTVRTAALDEYDVAGVGFVKIDVEGAEEAVLRGSTTLIARDRPILLVEAEERHNAGGLARMSTLLSGEAYAGHFVDGTTLRPLASFDVAADQPAHAVDTNGRNGRYINNFLFVPAEREEAVVSDVGALLTARPTVAGRGRRSLVRRLT